MKDRMRRSLEKMLEGVEVEWKPLGEVLARNKGIKITASQMRKLHKDGGDIKIFAGGETVAFVKSEDFDKNIHNGPSIIVKSRGVIEFEYYDKPFSHKSELWSYSNNDDNVSVKYIFHFLKLHEQHFKNIGGARQMPQIATPDTDTFLIPIPNHRVQLLVVGILDSLSNLSLHTENMISVLQTKYKYYREKLLQFGTDVSWKRLEDICVLRGGYTPSKSNPDYWYDGEVPWFRIEDIRDNGTVLNDSIQKVSASAIRGKGLFPKNSILISTSATIGEHALVTVPHLSNQRFTNLSLKDEYKEILDVKFLFYYGFILGEWCRNNTTSSSFDTVDADGFRKFLIPIPPMDIQIRIVRILDTLTDIIGQLDAERKAHDKQYEYYRDILLGF